MTPLADGLRTISRAAPYGEHEGAARRAAQWGPFPLPPGPDEGLLLGARNCADLIGAADWRCEEPAHWLFEGTGMQRGEAVPGLVGWEFHGDPALEVPGNTVVAAGRAFSPFAWAEQGSRAWAATVYPIAGGALAHAPSAFVFQAATIFWVQGLSSPPGHVLPWSHDSRPHGRACLEAPPPLELPTRTYTCFQHLRRATPATPAAGPTSACSR